MSISNAVVYLSARSADPEDPQTWILMCRIDSATTSVLHSESLTCPVGPSLTEPTGKRLLGLGVDDPSVLARAAAQAVRVYAEPGETVTVRILIPLDACTCTRPDGSVDDRNAGEWRAVCRDGEVRDFRRNGEMTPTDHTAHMARAQALVDAGELAPFDPTYGGTFDPGARQAIPVVADPSEPVSVTPVDGTEPPWCEAGRAERRAAHAEATAWDALNAAEAHQLSTLDLIRKLERQLADTGRLRADLARAREDERAARTARYEAEERFHEARLTLELARSQRDAALLEAATAPKPEPDTRTRFERDRDAEETRADIEYDRMVDDKVAP